MKNNRIFVQGLLALTFAGMGCAAQKEATNIAVEEDAGTVEEQEEFIPELDISALLTEDALFGDENLKLQINADVVKSLEDGAVWQIPFFFRSSVWHGNPWDHPSVLYVPGNLDPAKAGMVAVIQQGTNDLDPGLNQDKEFGVETAKALGIPVAVLSKVPHPTLFSSVESEFLSSERAECFESFLVEDQLQSCARELTWLEGKDKFSWALEIPMAKAYARAVKAIELVPQTLQNLDPPLEGVPSFSVDRIVLGGAGKRSRVLWMLAELDPRIAGIWIAGEDKANYKEFYQNQADVWDGGFVDVGPNEAKAFLDTEFGTTWEYLVDPYRHMENLGDVKVFLSRGSNDPYTPLGSYARYEEALPPHQWLMIPNAGYGMGTPAHVTTWRALISAVASGAGAHSVDVQVTRTGAEVEVVVQAPDLAAGPSSKVTIHMTTAQAGAEDQDLRDAVWESSATTYEGELADGRQRHTATVGVPNMGYWALFAHVTFTDGAGVKQEVSSPVWLSWEN